MGGKKVDAKTEGRPRGARSLSRERIVRTAIELLDESGEDGLTFRSLAERLASGAGAIYWHVTNRNDLLSSACDAILASALPAALDSLAPGLSAEETIRVVALATFDAMDAHPWMGSVLAQFPGQPVIRIVESLGQQIQALGVPEAEYWAITSALLNYILGVGGRNAANGQLSRMRGLDRSDFLDAVATEWSKLDARQYPFTRGLAAPLRAHDDRLDFLAGVDLILRGIARSRDGRSFGVV